MSQSFAILCLKSITVVLWGMFLSVSFAASDEAQLDLLPLPLSEINRLYEEHLVWALQNVELSPLEQERLCRKGLQHFPSADPLLLHLYEMLVAHHEVALAAMVCGAALDFGGAEPWQGRRNRHLIEVDRHNAKAPKEKSVQRWENIQRLQEAELAPDNLVENEFRVRSFLKEQISHFKAFMQLGSIYVAQGDEFMARAAFGLAHYVEPNNFDAASNYSLALARAGQSKEAFALIQGYFQEEELPLLFLVHASRLAKKEGYHQKAKALHERLLKEASASPELLYSLFELQRANPQEIFAGQIARFALKKYGETPSVCLMMAEWSFRKGESQESQEWLAKLKGQLGELKYDAVYKDSIFYEANHAE